jgi:glutamyl-tRNA synthetase
MPTAEIVKQFDIDRVSKAPAFFDFKKMLWIGNEYVKALSDEQYLK